MDETVRKWDGAAPAFQGAFKRGQSEYNAAVMTFLKEECGLAPGCRVLDIGCGVGKYGAYFAAMGCSVTLTDISPKMLEFAEKNLSAAGGSWRTICGDWRDVPTVGPAFAEKFDLAISTMSPAVCDVQTVEKMSAVTDGWCFATRFYKWDEPVRDEFLRRLGLPEKPGGRDLEKDCGELIRAVSAADFTPLVKYVDYDWCDVRTPMESAERFLSRYFDGEPGEEMLAAAIEAANDMAAGGTISDAVRSKAAWIYWTTKT